MLKDLKSKEIKNIDADKLNVLCDEIRQKIITTVSETGGHLASNLGIVETTVAMHYVFDFPEDKIVFDVGHQCYAHKLLSGRYDRFPTLRQEGGLSGFPKREESEYDSFDTGHAGTSVSAALGIAKARDLMGGDFNVVALIGDGSFNNGLIYEALNSIKILHTNILIILNDNGMSISPTVGGMHDLLNEIKTENTASIIDVALLERFGLKYVGTRNGNNVEEMVSAFKEVKPMLKHQPVLLHVTTMKGKGYDFCEDNPTIMHGVSPRKSIKQKEYSGVLGETLTALAEKNDKIVAVTAAMTDSLGLKHFFERFPERAIDVGICEEHASVLCAAMATQGMKPYYVIYSTFLQRAYDEIIHDVCCQKLPVTFCIDRAGVSGSDGETHQGVFDLSYLLPVPNLTVAVPKDLEEFAEMVKFSSYYPSPLAVRYPRGGVRSFGNHKKIINTEWEILQKNNSPVTVLACGERCLAMIEDICCERRLKINVVNARFVKPLDEKMLRAIDSEYIVTVEDNMLIGGFGSTVAEYFADSEKKVKNFGYRDCFIPQGEVPNLMSEYGLDKAEIEKYLTEICKIS